MPPDQGSTLRPTDITQQKGTQTVPGLRTPTHDAARFGGMNIPQSPNGGGGGTHVLVADEGEEVSLAPEAVADASSSLADLTVSGIQDDPAQAFLQADASTEDTVPIRPLTSRAVSQSPTSPSNVIEAGGHLDDFIGGETVTVGDASAATPHNDVGELGTPEPSVADLVAAAERDIEKVTVERKRLEERTSQLVRERKAIEDELDPIKQEQDEIDVRLGNVERSEHAAQTVAERRANEADRWEIVEERYQIELRLVKCRERLEAVADAIAKNETAYAELDKEEALLHKRIDTLEAEGKKRELKKTLEEATQTRKSVEEQSAKLGAERERIKELLLSLGQKETSLEAQTGKVGELEVGARSAAELRDLAQKRYQLEKERHETEAARWKAEDEIALIEVQYQDIADRLAKAEAKQVEIERKIRDLG